MTRPATPKARRTTDDPATEGRGQSGSRGDACPVDPDGDQLALLLSVLDALDVGLVVVGSDLATVRFMNVQGRRTLDPFATPNAHLPRLVREALAVQTSRELPCGRFARAAAVRAPSGQRYWVRARRLNGGGAVVLLSGSHLREADLVARLARHCGLSHREAEVVVHVYAGLRNREIGERLGVSEGRVEQYLVNVYATLGVRSRTALVAVIRDFATTQQQGEADAVEDS